MFLNLIAGIVLALSPQTLTIDPNVVKIPSYRESAGKWPDWNMSKVGYTTYIIKYNVGPNGFPKNGVLQFGFGYELKDYAATNNLMYINDFDYITVPNNATSISPIGQFQILNSTSYDYTTVNAPVSIKKKIIDRVNNSEALLQITFLDDVPANGIITIAFGDKTAGGPGAILPWNCGRPRVLVFQDPGGTGFFSLPPITFPILLFTGEKTDSFIVDIPITPIIGVPFDFTVSSVQGLDLNSESIIRPVENFEGIVTFSSNDTNAILPNDSTFTRQDQGSKRFSATFNTVGKKTIKALFKTPGGQVLAQGLSNVAIVKNTTLFSIYTGDLHRHSCEGGHASIPDWMCWRQLFNRNDNFGTVVEHSQLVFSGWRHANNMASAFQSENDSDENSFISFPGYEWGYSGGHRHVIFYDITTDPSISDGPYNGGEDPPPLVINNLDEFLNQLKNPPTPTLARLAIIHHPLWNSQHFNDGRFEWGSVYNEPIQPLVEIYSVHGSSEKYLYNPQPGDYLMHHDINLQRPPDEQASVQDALNMGYRFGIIANSDRHGYSQHVVSSDDDTGSYPRSGLTLIIGDMNIYSLRDRIWDAFTKKHVYASTGTRCYLSFTANNKSMGDEIIAPLGLIFNINMIASGMSSPVMPNIRHLYIYRDGYNEVLHKVYSGIVSEINESWSDSTIIPDGLYHSYYIKIVQDDEHIVWSSPIWWLIK